MLSRISDTPHILQLVAYLFEYNRAPTLPAYLNRGVLHVQFFLVASYHLRAYHLLPKSTVVRCFQILAGWHEHLHSLCAIALNESRGNAATAKKKRGLSDRPRISHWATAHKCLSIARFLYNIRAIRTPQANFR